MNTKTTATELAATVKADAKPKVKPTRKGTAKPKAKVKAKANAMPKGAARKAARTALRLQVRREAFDEDRGVKALLRSKGATRYEARAAKGHRDGAMCTLGWMQDAATRLKKTLWEQEQANGVTRYWIADKI
jgi:outer membrane biosynthesis protein TonB